jgi:hypothetical protein
MIFRFAGKTFGAVAALAAAAPLVFSSGTAFAWSGQSSGYGYVPTPQQAEEETYGTPEPRTYGATTNGAYDSPDRGTYAEMPAAAPQAEGYAYHPTPTEARAYTYGSPDAFAPTPPAGGYGSSVPPRARAYPAGRFVTISGLNMHVAPDVAAPVRTVLPAGTPVRVAGPDVGGWWPITSPYGAGWVYSRYLARG